MKCAEVSFSGRKLVIAAISVAVLALLTSAHAEITEETCGAGGPQTLKQIRDAKKDLKVVGPCFISSTLDLDKGRDSLLWIFRNVNIVSGGALIFQEGKPIDFYAESILVEFKGALTAVSSNAVPGYGTRLTIHLWGAPKDDGIECQSASVKDGPPCGIPELLWNANPGMAHNLEMTTPPPPTHPKNAKCKSVAGYSEYLPGDDCFYRYEVQDASDREKGLKAYFGHKVLAVSFGGTLHLQGSKGSIFTNPLNCKTTDPTNECSPANSGTSWVRLTGVAQDKQTLTLNKAVDWKKDDWVIVTTTDYLPGHSERVQLACDAGPAGSKFDCRSGLGSVPGNTIKLTAPLVNMHNASEYALPPVDNTNGPTSDIGPQDDPNTPDVKHAVDTRAVVGLLSRNIEIVSEGDKADPDSKDTFPPTPRTYFGGHTIVRQGFASYQVQGVRFYRLGQGGAKGRYSVHFHMLRSVPQPAKADDPPINYLKDCSIDESMTRWVTIHATSGMYLARNVGYASIGHGFYLEDATETDNKLYSNLGVFARAAVMNAQNPRQVPGILADTSDARPRFFDGMPYRSDYNHPSVFWIMNGWNDLQYNFAAGAGTCGACYWWLPGANSGPSQYQHWDGYASQQIFDIPGGTEENNFQSAGLTPLKNFVGNSCVAAMSAFQTVGATNDCNGVTAFGGADLPAVHTDEKIVPVPDYVHPTVFNLYYPTVTALREPSICAKANVKGADCSIGATPPTSKCDNQNPANCAATVIDRFTTSFNFAQTNFSAVWLRPKWYLVRNTAITDVQTGGLNFVTGGGYTRSDVPLGYWSVARKSAFIGHSQPFTANGVPENAFAADSGPFNRFTKDCDDTNSGYCLSVAEGVSLQLPPFPGQRLFNIYDGPAFQEDNFYLDINHTTTDCSPGSGTCPNNKDPLTRNVGVLKDNTNQCYLPNAAIAWKQPNGFYYPPAFNSKNLWFSDVDIRHFVVEPFFTTNPNDPYDPFFQNQPKIKGRYCTYNDETFEGFNHIDRQTVLNDEDGSLGGLLAQEITEKKGTITRATIMVNEDPFFQSPLITPECLSDIKVAPKNPNNLPFTAYTSPYEWLSTAITAACALPKPPTTPNKAQCLDSQNVIHWAHDCANPACRGVALYREYLNDSEKGTQPQIRMMGQDRAQRSTLTLNHGAYYIDTTQNCTSQGGCSTCTPDPENPTNNCFIQGSSRQTIFQGGQTYYVFFIYAKPSTHQTYDIYVTKELVDQLKVTPIRGNLPGGFEFHTVDDGGWVTTKPDPETGTVRVTVDLSGEQTVFDNSVSKFCQPPSFCAMKTVGGKQVCGCDPGNPKCTDDKVCAWGTEQLDCPMDPKFPSMMGCYGFAFTMPGNFEAPDLPKPPPSSLFVPYTDNAYFKAGKVTFNDKDSMGMPIKAGAACEYNGVPVQP